MADQVFGQLAAFPAPPLLVALILTTIPIMLVRNSPFRRTKPVVPQLYATEVANWQGVGGNPPLFATYPTSKTRWDSTFVPVLATQFDDPIAGCLPTAYATSKENRHYYGWYTEVCSRAHAGAFRELVYEPLLNNLLLSNDSRIGQYEFSYADGQLDTFGWYLSHIANDNLTQNEPTNVAPRSSPSRPDPRQPSHGARLACAPWRTALRP